MVLRPDRRRADAVRLRAAAGGHVGRAPDRTPARDVKAMSADAALPVSGKKKGEAVQYGLFPDAGVA